MFVVGLRSRVFLSRKALINQSIVPKRTLVCKESGAILPEPEKTSFGLVKVTAAVLPFLYVGATLGKEGAAFLEDNDIFVPDDDDDDWFVYEM